MNLAIFFDSETTGIPLFKEPSEHPSQPHILQLAARLVNLEKREIVSELNEIIKPDGWVIPLETTAIHGITTERALAEGKPEAEVLESFIGLWSEASVRIGHNEQFDARIIRIALKRFSDEATVVAWAAGKAECTAQMATSLCKLPPTAKMLAAGRSHYKTANLSEAYQHFMGKPMENAHNAMADVEACMAVYFAIRELSTASA